MIRRMLDKVILNLFCLLHKVILNWKENDRNEKKKQKPMPRDFVALNKKSIQNKVVTPHEVYEFRKTHDIRIQCKGVTKKEYKLPSDKDANHVYGVKTVYGESAKELIRNSYANEWVKEQEKLMVQRMEMEQKKKKESKRDVIVQSLKNVKKKPRQQQQEKQEFKMKKFLKVQPRVQIPK